MIDDADLERMFDDHDIELIVFALDFTRAHCIDGGVSRLHDLVAKQCCRRVEDEISSLLARIEDRLGTAKVPLDELAQVWRDLENEAPDG